GPRIQHPTLKILIVGHFGGIHLGTTFASAFRAMGHQVREVDPLAGLGSVPIALGADRAGATIGRAVRTAIGGRLLHLARPADLVLVMKGFLIPPFIWSALRRRTGGILVNFNPDNPF